MKIDTSAKNLENIRHSLAHLLAAAILKKFPKAKLGIGPVIENGFYYDFKLPKPLSTEDFAQLEETMRQLIKEKLKITGKKVTPAQARKMFADQPFKLDLINEFTKTKKPLTIYATSEVFTDLCRGGHVKNTDEINPEAFKLDRLAGAYWRGDEKNPQLTRVYGLAFATKEELEKYIWQQEEAKKRDHRVLGEKLGLFTFSEIVGPGLPLWMPKGTIIREQLEKYAKEVEEAWGYERVVTPHIGKEKLFQTSGHLPYYKEDMYPGMKLDDGTYYLKGMNCPFMHIIYKARPHSYRDLPVRYAEYGTVYRHELSGTLAGLLRVRGMTQNDAHIYCREDQVEEEFLNVMRLHEFWYKQVFGIKDFYLRLSLPAKDKKKYANVPEGWKKAVAMLRAIMKKSGLPFVEAEGEAAFYGPKVDFQIKSAIGREETASTNQLDFLATQRFNLTYTDRDGKEKPIYVIHRAPLGTHERFIAFLIEHYGGAFPLWLSPVQAMILPVGEKFAQYGQEILDQLKKAGIRAQLSDPNETLGKRIRESETQKIPYIIVVGQREQEAKTASIRSRDRGQIGERTITQLIAELQKEVAEKTHVDK